MTVKEGADRRHQLTGLVLEHIAAGVRESQLLGIRQRPLKTFEKILASATGTESSAPKTCNDPVCRCALKVDQAFSLKIDQGRTAAMMSRRCG